MPKGSAFGRTILWILATQFHNSSRATRRRSACVRQSTAGACLAFRSSSRISRSAGVNGYGSQIWAPVKRASSSSAPRCDQRVSSAATMSRNGISSCDSRYSSPFRFAGRTSSTRVHSPTWWPCCGRHQTQCELSICVSNSSEAARLAAASASAAVRACRRYADSRCRFFICFRSSRSRFFLRACRKSRFLRVSPRFFPERRPLRR